MGLIVVHPRRRKGRPDFFQIEGGGGGSDPPLYFQGMGWATIYATGFYALGKIGWDLGGGITCNPNAKKKTDDIIFHKKSQI